MGGAASQKNTGSRQRRRDYRVLRHLAAAVPGQRTPQGCVARPPSACCLIDQPRGPPRQFDASCCHRRAWFAPRPPPSSRSQIEPSPAARRPASACERVTHEAGRNRDSRRSGPLQTVQVTAPNRPVSPAGCRPRSAARGWRPYSGSPRPCGVLARVAVSALRDVEHGATLPRRHIQSLARSVGDLHRRVTASLLPSHWRSGAVTVRPACRATPRSSGGRSCLFRRRPAECRRVATSPVRRAHHAGISRDAVTRSSIRRASPVLDSRPRSRGRSPHAQPGQLIGSARRDWPVPPIDAPSAGSAGSVLAQRAFHLADRISAPPHCPDQILLFDAKPHRSHIPPSSRSSDCRSRCTDGLSSRRHSRRLRPAPSALDLPGRRVSKVRLRRSRRNIATQR